MKKKDLLDKWLNDELTPEEFEVIRTIPEFSSYQKIDFFVKDINLPEYDTVEGLNDLKGRLDTKKTVAKPKIISLSALSRIAALLLLVLASYYFIINYSTSVRTDLAQTEQFLLPDRSKVILNGDSEIEYKKNKWNDYRILSLTGEAYFEVTKGNTFKVETTDGTVTVIGTKFNVVARAGKFAVSCYEGMVRVTKGTVSVDLPAGKTTAMIAGELMLDNTYTTVPGWVYNESTFEDTLLPNVISELEKQYGFAVTTENIDVNLRFTGSFPNDDLEAAIQAITLPFNLNYRIENKDAVTIFAVQSSN